MEQQTTIKKGKTMIKELFINDGLIRVRLLSNQFIEEKYHWTDRKYHRCLGTSCVFCENRIKVTKKYRFLVFDYNAKAEVTINLPATAFKQVGALARDLDKNDICNSDLLIHRTRESDHTKYTLRFIAPKLDSNKIKALIEEYSNQSLDEIL
jgi:hypothetical protein